jgi:sugar/nucleoside kinase (ribokinase family)
MRPVAIVGNLTRDVVDGGPPRPGGTVFHAARALRALGREAVIVTRCAAADRETLLRPLVALGLPVVWGEAETTAAFSLDYRGQERTMTVDALADPWTPADARGWVADALRGTRWVHVGPLARSDFPPETLAELAHDRRLALDVQGLARPARTGPLELDGDIDPATFEPLRVLKLAEDEARVVAGGTDERSLARLGVPEILATFGERGSLVLARGRAQRVPAHPLELQPTGAGDAYCAAYVSSRSAGMSPEASARRATAAVAAVLRAG